MATDRHTMIIEEWLTINLQTNTTIPRRPMEVATIINGSSGLFTNGRDDYVILATIIWVQAIIWSYDLWSISMSMMPCSWPRSLSHHSPQLARLKYSAKLLHREYLRTHTGNSLRSLFQRTSKVLICTHIQEKTLPSKAGGWGRGGQNEYGPSHIWS